MRGVRNASGAGGSLAETAGMTISADTLRQAARAENTRTAYEKAWRCFAGWCSQTDRDPAEAGSDDVVAFLVEMGSEGRPDGRPPMALNTLRLYRTGLNDRWRRAGLPSPAAATAVDEVLKGMARIRGDRPRQAKAIREGQLQAMLEACGDGRHGVRDAAVLALGFAAALRRSEIVGLGVDDLQRKDAGQMLVRIRRSKTDARGAGQTVAVMDGQAIKPIERVDRWLAESGIRTGAVFQSLRRGGKPSRRPLDSGEVARIVKRYAAKIGLDPAEFSAHSLRAGFVTSAAAHHARIDKIMEVTRHRSANMVLSYIRDEESFTDHAAAGFL